MQPFKRAKRIWRENNGEPNQYARFSACFERAASDAVLRIRADGRYYAVLNGEEIAAQQYSDYGHYPVFDEIPLGKERLSHEPNQLVILAYCQNEDSSTYRVGEPSLIFEITDSDGRILCASGAETDVSADTGFVSGAVEKISPQLSYSFRYDASLAATPHYTRPKILTDLSDYHPRPIPQLTIGEPKEARVIRRGTFVSADADTSGGRVMGDALTVLCDDICTFPLSCHSEADDGIFLTVDLGEESVGLPLIEIETADAVLIDVAFGEHLSDGRVRAVIGTRNFAFSIRTQPGRQRIFSPIKRIGCRYLELHVHAHDFELLYAGLRPVDYPVTQRPMPPLETEEDTAIYRAAIHTLRCCMHEHYEDCPWREQALYAMDSRNQMLFGYDAFGETAMPRESLRLLALGQADDGLLELCAPARVPVNIPCFSLIWICALNEYLDHSGDTAFIREMLPVARRVLGFFERIEENGLIRAPRGRWNFYEWSEGLDGSLSEIHSATRQDTFEAPLQAFYAMALSAMAKMTGDTAYHSRFVLLKARYRETFYDEKRDAYRLSTVDDAFPELLQILTAAAGLCRNGEEKSRLLDRVDTGVFRPAVTLSHRIFYYEALIGEKDWQARMLADVRRHYLPMVSSGATTLFETEKGADDFGGAGSLCHGWSAAPIYAYFRMAESQTGLHGS